MILHLDLDNTIIYSARRGIGSRKKCVEYYQGRGVSFVTERTAELFGSLPESVLAVPTTTRTIEQYRRIDLMAGPLRYALVCNGGVLLKDGAEDAEWYEESLRLAAGSAAECERAREILLADENRIFEVRYIQNLFLFTKSADSGKTVAALREKLDPALVDVFLNGNKVYVIPANLDKGTAVRRFRKRIANERRGGEPVFAAGDSVADLSMLREADVGIAPRELAGLPGLRKDAVIMDGTHVFSDDLLEFVLRSADCRRNSREGLRVCTEGK